METKITVFVVTVFDCYEAVGSPRIAATATAAARVASEMLGGVAKGTDQRAEGHKGNALLGVRIEEVEVES